MTLVLDRQLDAAAVRSDRVVPAASAPFARSVGVVVLTSLASLVAPSFAYFVTLMVIGRHTASTAAALAVGAAALAAVVAWRRHRRLPSLAAIRPGSTARMFDALATVGVVATAAAAIDRRFGTPYEWLIGTAAALAAYTVARVATAGVSARASRVGERRVVVVGQGDEVAHLRALVERHRGAGWTVVGAASSRGDGSAAERSLATVVQSAGATSVLVGVGALHDDALRVDLAALAKHRIEVHIDAGLNGFDPRRVRVAPLGHDPFLQVSRPALLHVQFAAKRAIDIALASILLVVAAPVLALAAAAIKAEDGGPILFAQTRVGRDGRPFRLLKLRTMVPQAEARLADLRHLNERDGPLFKLTSDPRVTRVGRVLRATSLDELPQLVHVIRGSMSLVGPRPALPSEVMAFDPRLATRHAVRPGLTGLWQVEQRDSALFDAYRQLDLFYVENWSLTLDLAILLHTVPAVVGRAWRALGRSR